jgi:thymidylate synthase (FAD)
MGRPDYPTVNKSIGERVRVLDHGFVCLVDYMGDDQAIVQAARVSYGAGTRKGRSDRGLIRYLLRHRHTTPFEMVEFKFLVRLPIFVARQWIRHRTASVNEYSARYSIVPDEYYLPPVDAIRKQSTRNRQGRDEPVPQEVAKKFQDEVKRIASESYKVYEWALSEGIARELARIVLPVDYYTEWYWKIDLHNLFHFLSLRLDAHSQEEIRAYAAKMAELARPVCPISFEAFEEFTLEGMRLSKAEQVAVAAMLKGESFERACDSAGLKLVDGKGQPAKSGEGVEFREKLERIRARLG